MTLVILLTDDKIWWGNARLPLGSLSSISYKDSMEDALDALYHEINVLNPDSIQVFLLLSRQQTSTTVLPKLTGRQLRKLVYQSLNSPAYICSGYALTQADVPSTPSASILTSYTIGHTSDLTLFFSFLKEIPYTVTGVYSLPVWAYSTILKRQYDYGHTTTTGKIVIIHPQEFSPILLIIEGETLSFVKVLTEKETLENEFQHMYVLAKNRFAQEEPQILFWGQKDYSLQYLNLKMHSVVELLPDIFLTPHEGDCGLFQLSPFSGERKLWQFYRLLRLILPILVVVLFCFAGGAYFMDYHYQTKTQYYQSQIQFSEERSLPQEFYTQRAILKLYEQADVSSLLHTWHLLAPALMQLPPLHKFTFINNLQQPWSITISVELPDNIEASLETLQEMLPDYSVAIKEKPAAANPHMSYYAAISQSYSKLREKPHSAKPNLSFVIQPSEEKK